MKMKLHRRLFWLPGGNSEESAAQYIAETIDKPVIAYVAGCRPAGKHWGHAGH